MSDSGSNDIASIAILDPSYYDGMSESGIVVNVAIPVKEVVLRAFKLSMCMKLPDSIRVSFGYKSPLSVYIANSIGCVMYIMIIATLAVFDWKNMQSALPVRFNIDETYNIYLKIFIPLVIVLYGFLSEMGNAKSQIEEIRYREAVEDEIKAARKEREAARKEREAAEQFRCHASNEFKAAGRDRNEARRFRSQGIAEFRAAAKERRAANVFRSEGQYHFAQAANETQNMVMFREDLSDFCLMLAEHQIATAERC